jgi:hypothetical protein
MPMRGGLTNAMAAPDIWIVSVDEPLFYGRLYSQLARACSDRIKGAIIVRNPETSTFSRLFREVIYRLRFWGIRGSCYAVVASLWSRSFGKGNLARTCRNNGIAVNYTDSLAEAGECLRRERAGVVLCSFPRRVPKECLMAVPGGWVNTHCGPLPNYRGLDAPFWCLHNEEAYLAVTLHYMAEEFDTGPIIAQRQIANSGEPYFVILRKLFAVALDMHTEFVRTAHPSFSEASSQDPSAGSYYGRPEPSLGAAFRRRGGRFV